MLKTNRSALILIHLSICLSLASCSSGTDDTNCIASEQTRTFINASSGQASQRIVACAPIQPQADTSCSTLISGEQIRKFTTVEPGQILPLPLSGRTYSLIPDQTAGEYYVELLIGNQPILFIADTGSSNIIIDSNDFTPDQSKFLGQSFNVSFGTGSGLAQKYADNVSLNCVDASLPYTVGVIEQDTFCQEIPRPASCLPSILGLAYPSIAAPLPPQTPIVPFFDQIVLDNSGSIVEIFAMALCGHKTGDAIVLGGPHPSVAQSALTYVPIIKESYYAIDARSMVVEDWNKIGDSWISSPGAFTLVGDFPILQADGNGIETIIDSGTTMNILPTEIFTNAIAVLRAASVGLGIPDDFWTAQPGDTNYSMAIAPNIIAQLPKFQVVVRGMGGEFVGLDLLPDNYLKQLDVAGERTSSFRKASFLNILGQAFMEGHYIEFDRVSHPNRIGFASNNTICMDS